MTGTIHVEDSHHKSKSDSTVLAQVLGIFLKPFLATAQPSDLQPGGGGFQRIVEARRFHRGEVTQNGMT